MGTPSEEEQVIIWLQLLSGQMLANADNYEDYVLACQQQDDQDDYDLSYHAASMIFMKTLAGAVDDTIEDEDTKTNIAVTLEKEGVSPLDVATVIAKNVTEAVIDKFNSTGAIEEVEELIAAQGITPYHEAIFEGIYQEEGYCEDLVNNLNGILEASIEYTEKLKKEGAKGNVLSIVPKPN